MSGAAVKPTGPPAQPLQKNRAGVPQRETSSSAQRWGPTGPLARSVISLVVVWHFTAVFLAAMSSAPPTSPLVADVAQRPPMQWYLDLLYLNHGHSFFAPDVGPGHVLRYELFDASGVAIDRVQLPNTKDYWPRLRYHRHLMLADQAGVPSPDREFSDRWLRKYLDAYAYHLLRENEEAQTVRIGRYAHWPLPRELALKGAKEGYKLYRQEVARLGGILDDEGYEQLMEVTLHRRDTEPLPMDQGRVWQEDRLGSPWIGGPR